VKAILQQAVVGSVAQSTSTRGSSPDKDKDLITFDLVLSILKDEARHEEEFEAFLQDLDLMERGGRDANRQSCEDGRTEGKEKHLPTIERVDCPECGGTMIRITVERTRPTRTPWNTTSSGSLSSA